MGNGKGQLLDERNFVARLGELTEKHILWWERTENNYVTERNGAIITVKDGPVRTLEIREKKGGRTHTITDQETIGLLCLVLECVTHPRYQPPPE